MSKSLPHRVKLSPSQGAEVLISNTVLRAGGSLLVAMLLTGLTFALVACHNDRRESFYPSLVEADKDGGTTRGWVPDDLLPSHSQAIHEVHEISPSNEWCAFEFPASDSDNLRKKLKSVDAPPPSVKRVPSPSVSWWPAVLTGNLDADMIHKAGFELYVVEKQATSVSTDILLFAIDWKRDAVFSTGYLKVVLRPRVPQKAMP